MESNNLKELALKATPGPWEVDPIYSFIIDKNGEPIEFFDEDGPCDNADYIAAANPAAVLELIARHDDLLAALKGAIAAWDGVYPHLKSDVHSQDYIEEIEWTQMQAARAAIAKCEVKS